MIRLRNITKIEMALAVLAGIMVLLPIASWWAEVPNPEDESYDQAVFVAASATCIFVATAIFATTGLLALAYFRHEFPRSKSEDKASQRRPK